MKHTKKCIGLLVAFAIVSQLTNPVTGIDAAAKPKLSTKSVKIKVGKSKTVKVKNAKGYKLTVKSKKKTVKKGKKKVNLKCTVKVSKDTKPETPATQTPATQTPATPSGPINQTPAPTAPTTEPTHTPYAYIPPEPINIELPTDVPAKYRETADEAPASQRGTIETITYETETYDEGNSVKMSKQANVYLPAGYDASKQYNVLYLMHGGGENMNTWLVENDYSGNKKMVDNLIANGEINPLIIVTPTFYRPSDVPEPDGDFDLTTIFQHELRKDLIPYIESHYSTYAGGDVSDENLIKTRMHRAFAGLSMGSMTTYRSALYANYDVFAWFGPYSGCQGPGGDQDAEADKIVSVIEAGYEKGMPLGFLYCGNGVDDIAHDEHVNIMKKAVSITDKLVEGANYAFIDLPRLERSYGGYTGEHSMWSWHIHLYNCLRVFFTRE